MCAAFFVFFALVGLEIREEVVMEARSSTLVAK